MIIQLKYVDILKTKEELLKNQEGKCAICGKEISLGEAVLDHQHKNKRSDVNGVNGNGLIRGVLCRDCNCMEGKVWNNLKRYKQCLTVQERVEWLNNLISYYGKGTLPLIHPTERAKEKKVSKRQFNRLCKITNKKLVYPKSGMLTKPLKALFDKYCLSPYT